MWLMKKSGETVGRVVVERRLKDGWWMAVWKRKEGGWWSKMRGGEQRITSQLEMRHKEQKHHQAATDPECCSCLVPSSSNRSPLHLSSSRQHLFNFKTYLSIE